MPHQQFRRNIFSTLTSRRRHSHDFSFAGQELLHFLGRMLGAAVLKRPKKCQQLIKVIAQLSF